MNEEHNSPSSYALLLQGYVMKPHLYTCKGVQRGNDRQRDPNHTLSVPSQDITGATGSTVWVKTHQSSSMESFQEQLSN